MSGIYLRPAVWLLQAPRERLDRRNMEAGRSWEDAAGAADGVFNAL